ncbi:MAG: hypothetical protein IJF65_01935 [Clostridia bacterium]|nr:hypothetical protein [Clostridia bacterium]
MIRNRQTVEKTRNRKAADIFASGLYLLSLQPRCLAFQYFSTSVGAEFAGTLTMPGIIRHRLFADEAALETVETKLHIVRAFFDIMLFEQQIKGGMEDAGH